MMNWGWLSVNTDLAPKDFLGLMNQRMKLLTGALALTQSSLGMVNVEDFKSKVVGPDWTAALNAAGTQLAPTGGMLWLPPNRNYGISGNGVQIRSTHAITIASGMGGALYNAPTSCLYPLGNITGSMLTYQTPVGATRANHGGGRITGLTFADISNRAGVTIKGRRQYTMTAAIDARDFNVSMIDNCNFNFLKGSAVRTDYCIKSSIKDCGFGWCGDTSLPTIDINSTDATFASQAVVIDNNKLEVNYDAPYIQLGALALNIHVTNNGFEADTVTDATSNQYFLRENGGRNVVSHNRFNRNTLAYPVFLNSKSTFTGNWLSGMASGALRLGTSCAATGNVFDDNTATNPVTIPGTNNTLIGNVFGYANSTVLFGADGQHQNRVADNEGMNCEANGVATVLNATTSIVVTHGLYATPDLQDIGVTPTNNLGSATKFWISTVTATQFTINVDVNPGATTATFAWSAQIV